MAQSIQTLYNLLTQYITYLCENGFHFGWLLLLVAVVTSYASELFREEVFTAHCGRGYRLYSDPAWEYNVSSMEECLLMCLSQRNCSAVNVITPWQRRNEVWNV